MIAASIFGISMAAILLVTNAASPSKDPMDPGEITVSLNIYCGPDVNIRQRHAGFQASHDRLRQDMQDYQSVHDRLVERPTRAPVKGRPDPHIEEREQIATAAFSVQMTLRELLPVEDYPLAILGWDRMLRDGDIPDPTGHGREHLLSQTAFTLALLDLIPEAGAIGGDFIQPLNESYANTDIDIRKMQKPAGHDEIITAMNRTVERFPAFDEAVEKLLRHADFDRTFARHAIQLCSDRHR